LRLHRPTKRFWFGVYWAGYWIHVVLAATLAWQIEPFWGNWIYYVAKQCLWGLLWPIFLAASLLSRCGS